MISCEHHDYIEIACLYNYRVRLILDSGAELEGTAVDTGRNQSNEECIKIRVGNADNLVVLDSIKTLEVLVENPHFNSVTFK
jgi:Rho-binding antiterminator